MKVKVGIGNGRTVCKLCRKFIRAGQRIIILSSFAAVDVGKPAFDRQTHIHSDPEDCHDSRTKHPVTIYRDSAIDRAAHKLARSQQKVGSKWPRKPIPVDNAGRVCFQVKRPDTEPCSD